MLSSCILNRAGRTLSAGQTLRAFCSVRKREHEEILNTPLSKKVDKSKYKIDETDDEVKPVTYTTSKAFAFKASENFRMDNDSPPSQYYFVTISVALFLIYFILLREENDLDERLYTPWKGNEQILKTILQVQLKKTTDEEQIIKLNAKIAELDETLKKNEKEA